MSKLLQYLPSFCMFNHTQFQHYNLEQERDDGFALRRIDLKRASVILVTEMSRQGLIPEDVEHHEPPRESDAATAHAQCSVDQQFGQVVRAGHQLEPASTGDPVGKRLHST